MLMQKVLNATDVRKEWGKFIDEVVRIRPQMVKRNRDYFLSLSVEHISILLEPFRFKLEMQEDDDGTFIATFEDFDLIGTGDDQDEALANLIQELKEYAVEYIDHIPLYMNAPNRKKHSLTS